MTGVGFKQVQRDTVLFVTSSTQVTSYFLGRKGHQMELDSLGGELRCSVVSDTADGFVVARAEGTVSAVGQKKIHPACTCSRPKHRRVGIVTSACICKHTRADWRRTLDLIGFFFAIWLCATGCMQASTRTNPRGGVLPWVSTARRKS